MKSSTKFLLAVFSLLVSSNVLVAQSQEEQAEEQSKPWTVSLRSRVKTAELKRGVDISGDQGTLGFGATLVHTSGWNGSVSTISGLQTKGTLSTSFGLGYDYSVTDAFSIAVDFSHTTYSSDSLNAVASLNNSLSIGLDYDFDVVDLSFSLERFFGASPATYGGIDISTSLDFDKLIIIPSLDVSFVSQTVDVTKISSQKGKHSGTLTSPPQSIAGLSGIAVDAIVTYALGWGVSLSSNPMLTYSAQSDLSVRSLTFSITAGIKYSLSF